MSRYLRALLASSVLSVLPFAAYATQVIDVSPLPIPSTSNTTGASEFNLQSYAITGGTLYCGFMRQPGQTGQPFSPTGCTFTSSTVLSPTRYQPLTAAKCDNGVAIAASAAAGCVGIARTAGTSINLPGEATSASAKTDKALWELSLADSYVTGAAIPVTVNCNYTGGGTVTGASTTMTVNAYAVSAAGVETALTVTPPGSTQIGATAGNLVYSIAGTGLSPSSHIEVELVMLVTSSSGANTGQINSVALQE